jgi:hypothetical protein
MGLFLDLGLVAYDFYYFLIAQKVIKKGHPSRTWPAAHSPSAVKREL